MSSDADTEQGELSWTDAATGLRVRCRLRRFRSFPAVEWTLHLENTGSADTPVIEAIDSLRLRLQSPRAAEPFVIHGTKGGRSEPDDMQPFALLVSTHSPAHPQFRFDGNFPSSNAYLPFFNIETPDRRGVLFGVGWSGHWVAEMKADTGTLAVQAGLNQARFVLRPGEAVRLPRMLALFWQGQRLHGHNMFRRLLHQHYVPRLNNAPQRPLVSVNVCFTHHSRYGTFLEQTDEASLLALVEPFAKIGAELMIVDAGWYDCPNGWMAPASDWRWSPTRFPRGFRPVADRLAAHHMALGVWFWSEFAPATMPVTREHPGWNKRGMLPMELTEARAWFLERVDAVMADGARGYRQDGHAPFPNEPDDRRRIDELHHLAGLYATWDAIAQRYPGMIMEGCSGGGRRIDLETVARFHWHQKADRWFQTEEDQCSLYGASLYLPGGVINVPTQATDDYGVWSSFAGQLCLAWHPLDDDFPVERATRLVAQYKRTRELLSGDFYPLTPCALDAEWIGYQFHRPDVNQGFALVFRRSPRGRTPCPASATFRLRLRGLDPTRRYRLRLETGGSTTTLPGAVLGAGLELTLAQAPGAELIFYGEK